MLAWLVNNNYLSKIELADPCFIPLKIHGVLFPSGQPISMEGFTGYQADEKTNGQNALTNSTTTSLDISNNLSPISTDNIHQTNGTLSKALTPIVSEKAGPGEFTLDNSKQYLHQFMQKHNIKADYEYESQGPAHQK